MDYIRARLREPSTWAGIGVLYVVVESALSGGDWKTSLPAVLAAVIAVMKGDARVA